MATVQGIATTSRWSLDDRGRSCDLRGNQPLADQAAELAQRCWDEDETFSGGIRRGLEIREFCLALLVRSALKTNPSHKLNRLALRAYLNRFDFSRLRLDVAFRHLCQKLYLKAETQQVDRILDQFSQRYSIINQNLLYGSADIVHIVTYTLLLLQYRPSRCPWAYAEYEDEFVKDAMSAVTAQNDK